MTAIRGRGRARRRSSLDTSPQLGVMVSSWQLHLEAAGKADKTIKDYVGSATKLVAYLEKEDMPTTVDGVTTFHIRSYLAAERSRTSASSAAHEYRNLRVLWNWLCKEHERTGASPMEGVDRPAVSPEEKLPLSDRELKALLATCAGSSWDDRRDTAMLRILMDNGMRVSSLAGLRFHLSDEDQTDVFLQRHKLRIRNKGGAIVFVPIGRKTAAAIDRYLRVRSTHAEADSPFLWLGNRGRKTRGMTASGIHQMIKRRARQAGIQDVHPHRFRRTFADGWLEDGGNIEDLMAIGNWKSYDSIKPYIQGRRVARAQSAHGRLSRSDRL